MYNVLPFQNTLVTFELTGAQLQQLRASQVVTLESEEGQRYGPEAKLQVSGVTYEWVGHNDIDERIRDVWVDGEPIDEDSTVTETSSSGDTPGFTPVSAVAALVAAALVAFRRV